MLADAPFLTTREAVTAARTVAAQIATPFGESRPRVDVGRCDRRGRSAIRCRVRIRADRLDARLGLLIREQLDAYVVLAGDLEVNRPASGRTVQRNRPLAGAASIEETHGVFANTAPLYRNVRLSVEPSV